MARLVLFGACLCIVDAARVDREISHLNNWDDDDIVQRIAAVTGVDDFRERRGLLRKIAKDLAKMDDVPDGVVTKIISIMENDSHGDVRRAAAGGLGRMGEQIGEGGFAALEKCLKRDDHGPARRDCAFQFGRLGGYVGSVPTLIEAMEDDDAEVRRESIVAIGKVAFKSGNDAVSDAVPGIEKALQSDVEDTVRREAAVALGVIKNPYTAQALPTLATAAKSDSSMSVRRESVRAMIYLLGDEAAVQKAASILKEVSENDENEEVQTAAKNILKRMKLLDE
jgi:HEAT repeat protein